MDMKTYDMSLAQHLLGKQSLVADRHDPKNETLL